jgi:hypothetical protein
LVDFNAKGDTSGRAPFKAFLKASGAPNARAEPFVLRLMMPAKRQNATKAGAFQRPTQAKKNFAGSVKRDINGWPSHTAVELIYRNRRIISHLRSHIRGGHTTESAHMPSSHRAFAEWTPSRMVKWAEDFGPAVGAVIKKILAAKPHPEMGFRSALGVIRLGKQFGKEKRENRKGLQQGAGDELSHLPYTQEHACQRNGKRAATVSRKDKAT